MFKIKKTTDRSDKYQKEYEFINKHSKHLRDSAHQQKKDTFLEENMGEMALHLEVEKQLLQRMGIPPQQIKIELKRSAKMFCQRKKYVTKKIDEDRIREKLFDKHEKDELFT